MRKIFVWVAGIFLILLGIIGLILPIMPGWVLIFLGLSFIAPKLAQKLRRRIFRKFFKSDIVHLEEWKKTRAQAGFTTRHFPLFLSKTDDLLEEANQKKFIALLSESPVIKSRRLGPLKKFVLLKQVHGEQLAVLEDSASYAREGFYHVPGSDGAVTNIPGLTLLVFSADCLPIFFLAGRWIGLVHAGWRGTQNQIAPKVLKLLSEKSGRKPKNIRVLFGPRIGVGHYEVGQEFRTIFPASSLVEKNNKLYFDLAKENARQLKDAGAAGRRISDHEICTVSENDDFYSFRKEGDKAGRNVSFISLSPLVRAEKGS